MDLIDRANTHAEHILAANIENARAHNAPNSIVDCIDCDKPIGDKRKQAMPSAVRCIQCQSAWERR